VATPDVRGRLLRAAERVLLRDGPDAVTARAVTREAGCATGVLYTHFSDLDEFLAEVVRAYWARLAAHAAALPGKAGTATVIDNLVEVAAGLLEARVFAIVRLVQSRPAVTARLAAAREATGAMPALRQVEDMIVKYLEAERGLGRVAESADPGAAATLLFGAVFHLVMHHAGAVEPDPVAGRELVRRIVTALVSGLAP
jgi:AcrR family transcriptional regulator